MNPHSQPQSRSAAPANPAAQAGDRVVHLAWKSVADADLDSYSIHRSESADGPFAEVHVGLAQGEWADAAVVNGRSCHYVVTAVDGSSNAPPFSPVVSVTPGPADKVSRVSARDGGGR
jgi:large repetitive protein